MAVNGTLTSVSDTLFPISDTLFLWSKLGVKAENGANLDFFQLKRAFSELFVVILCGFMKLTSDERERIGSR